MKRHDLLVVVADHNMKGVFEELLGRPESLRIRKITFRVVKQDGNDPGVFRNSPELLRGLSNAADKFIVALDFDWTRPKKINSPDVLREDLEKRLNSVGISRGRLLVLVMHPELETWIFVDSPYVAEHLGFESFQALREMLRKAGLWDVNSAKPEDPKVALEHALRHSRRPRSSAIYRKIAKQVTLEPERCRDPSFREFVGILRAWFPPPASR